MLVPWLLAAALAAPMHDTSTFSAADGTSLYAERWAPDGDPRAVLIVIHGLKDYADRYGELAASLNAKGIAVEAFDLRGHGHSGGKPVRVKEFTDYTGDVGTFYDQVAARYPDKPIFIFGHSMGGGIVARFALDGDRKLSGVVLSGAALAHHDVPGALVGVTKLLAGPFPGLAVMALDDDKFCHDPAVVASMRSDPLVHDGKGPARTAAEILRNMDVVQARAGELTLPLLVLHGGDDPITEPQGSKDLVAKAGSTDKTLQIYPGLWHDLVHEPDKAVVIGDITAWLDARAPAIAPAL